MSKPTSTKKGIVNKKICYRCKIEDGVHCYYKYEFPFGKERLVAKFRTAEEANCYEMGLNMNFIKDIK